MKAMNLNEWPEDVVARGKTNDGAFPFEVIKLVFKDLPDFP